MKNGISFEITSIKNKTLILWHLDFFNLVTTYFSICIPRCLISYCCLTTSKKSFQLQTLANLISRHCVNYQWLRNFKFVKPTNNCFKVCKVIKINSLFDQLSSLTNLQKLGQTVTFKTVEVKCDGVHISIHTKKVKSKKLKTACVFIFCHLNLNWKILGKN